MNRREFLFATAAAAFAAEKSEAAPVASGSGKKTDAKSGRLIVSAPMLQNHAEDSVGVAFAVSALANGFVEYSTDKDMKRAKKVKCGGYRVTDMNDKVMLVRLRGLKSATTYYYRIGADRIEYKGGYKMKRLGTEMDPVVYSFTTAGAKAAGHFAVINDTHEQWKPFALAVEKIEELDPPCVVWNGDATNCEESIDRHIRIFLDPGIERKDYASRRPYSIAVGNHEVRGMAGRSLERTWMFRDPEERPSRDWDLGRNFAVRQGDIAMIGLDTGEDKPDGHPAFAGLFCSEPYREAQAAWLRDALRRPEIADAPYLVAFCHIPIFYSNPAVVKTADERRSRLKTDYKYWQKDCGRMWGPLLEKAGCQAVISAHMHTMIVEPACAHCRWAQIVGGGPRLAPPESKKFPTVIEGKVEKGKLRISVHDVFNRRVAEELFFKPRRRT
jgi:hypothetical protein